MRIRNTGSSAPVPPTCTAPWRRTRCPPPEIHLGRRLLRRQRYPLGFARHLAEALRLPILTGLDDALLARRDEVPRHIAMAIQRLAADQHEMRRRCRLD